MPHYLLTLPLLARQALAAAVLTGPAPGAVYYEDSSCIVQWNPDTTGTWKNMTIDLMSGPNLSMTKVTTVATGLDGSDSSLTPFNWTCPQVTPCSAIYFYQIYDSNTQDSPSWTGRFTIASPHGASIPPPNATQPDGEAIPWGFGSLASKGSNSTSIPLPSMAAPNPGANSTATAASSVSTGDSDGSTEKVSSSGEERPHSGKSREHGKDEDDEGNDDDRGDEYDDRQDDEDKYDDDGQYDHHGKHADDDDGKNNDQGTNHDQNSGASSAGNTQNTSQTTASFDSMADRNVHGANQIPVPGARSLAATYTSNAARELPWSVHVGVIATLCWLSYIIV